MTALTGASVCIASMRNYVCAYVRERESARVSVQYGEQWLECKCLHVHCAVESVESSVRAAKCTLLHVYTHTRAGRCCCCSQKIRCWVWSCGCAKVIGCMCVCVCVVVVVAVVGMSVGARVGAKVGLG